MIIVMLLLMDVMFQSAVLKCRCHILSHDFSKNKIYAMCVERTPREARRLNLCDLIVAAETASSCFKLASTRRLTGLKAQVSFEPTCRCRLRYLRMPLGRSWLSM